MWPFTKKSMKPSDSQQLQDILDRLEGLERGVRRSAGTLEDFQEEVGKRFGKVWARFKRSKNDDQEEMDLQDAEAKSEAPRGTHGVLNEMRRRRGLLSR